MTDNQYALEDVWLKAFHAFPDVKPLMALLRSDTPMPHGARDLLAELLCPGDPPIDSYMLELKKNPKFDLMLDKHLITTRYNELRATGLSHENAVEQAGEERLLHKYHHVGGRQAWRYIKEDIPRRLIRRLFKRE
jgi:hypothetical protein